MKSYKVHRKTKVKKEIHRILIIIATFKKKGDVKLDNMTLPIIIFISFPEAILITLLGTFLLNIKPSLKQIVIIGLAQASVSFLIRSLPIPFGIHTLLQLFTFSLLIYFIIPTTYKISLISVILGIFTYGIIEAISAPFMLHLSGLSLEYVLNNQWLRIAFFLPEALALCLCIYLIKKYNITMPGKFLNYIGTKKRSKVDIPLVSVILIQTYLFTLLIIVNFVANNQGFSMRHFVATNIFIFVLIIGITIILFKRTLKLIQEDILNKQEQQRIEYEMARLSSLNVVGQVAASLGHEIRNPMTTIRGFLQLISNKEEYFKDKEYFDIMVDELDRANGIITEFLFLAKNKAVELKEDDLNEKIEHIYPLLLSDAVNFDKNIIFDKGEIPKFKFDEKEIRQLLINIVRNGLQAMTAGGTVKIKTYSEVGSVVLEVQDEGKGISEEILSQLGTPFITDKEGGTGLGLAVCYSIAHRHNAKIDVKTGTEGTTFCILFNLN